MGGNGRPAAGAAGHPFFEWLNRSLTRAGVAAFVEGLCAPFAVWMGRPRLGPRRYVRLLLVGYVKGLDSEQAITWRAADSLSRRSFLRLAAAGERRGASGGLHLGAGVARRRRLDAGHDGRHRRDDTGGERGVAAASSHPPPRHGRGRHGARRGWPKRRASRRRPVPRWRGLTGPGRGGLRQVGFLRAVAAAHGRLGGVSRWGATAGGHPTPTPWTTGSMSSMIKCRYGPLERRTRCDSAS